MHADWLPRGGQAYSVTLAPKGHGHYGTVHAIHDHDNGEYSVDYCAKVRWLLMAIGWPLIANDGEHSVDYCARVPLTAADGR